VTLAAAPLFAPPKLAVRAVPVALGGATVAAQIAYPLVDGQARTALTMVTVVLFAAASVSHALIWRGARFAATLVAVAAGGGLLVEALGVATGFPFGAYVYTGTLAPKVLGVPWVIPLAWLMMAYPSLLVGRRIARSRTGGALAAALALATWDLYLDPQMVDAGHWLWDGGGPLLLGIPLTNFAGWLLAALVMMAVLVPRLAALPDQGVDDRLPLALYLWTWAGSLIAHALFLDLPGSALLGGLGMGLVVAALCRPRPPHA
jgi:putative membrane protein